MKEVEIDGEIINIHKGKFGWKVVYPIRNKDNSINYKNLIAGGNWFNLILIIVFVILAIGSIIEYSNAINTANECLTKLDYYKEIIPTWTD